MPSVATPEPPTIPDPSLAPSPTRTSAAQTAQCYDPFEGWYVPCTPEEHLAEVREQQHPSAEACEAMMYPALPATCRANGHPYGSTAGSGQ